MKKRLILCLSTAVLAMGLAACGNKDNNTDNNDNGTMGEETTQYYNETETTQSDAGITDSEVESQNEYSTDNAGGLMDDVGNAARDLGEGVGDVANDVGNAVGDIADGVGNGADSGAAGGAGDMSPAAGGATGSGS